jgi:aspartyl-tRNA(Asn)/glutamyl-tRNA(Gln) amidotransferase subunit C
MPDRPSIDRQLLGSLAGLARLHVPAERQPVVLEHLLRILDAFDALRDVPTPDAAGPSLAGAQTTPLRADEAAPALPVERVLANAPQAAADTFVVPRVVDA